MSSYSPGRPPTERDVVQGLSGMPVFLGVLTSTGAAVSNVTTAVPFNAAAKNPPLFTGTLAGKILLLQPTAAGLALPWANSTLVVSQQTTTPVPLVSVPGVLVGINERVILTMDPVTSFLQWVSVTGTASCLVWELV